MKKTKFLSALTATAISACMMFGTLGTASACSNCNPPTDEVHGMGDMPDYYTLDQLFKMNDEEFLALECDGISAKGLYDVIEMNKNKVTTLSNTTEYGGISGSLMRRLNDEDYGSVYTANITEADLENLIGNTVDYSIVSPISITSPGLEFTPYYADIIWVEFPDYYLSAEEDNITDEQVVEFAKCWFCVSQIISDFELYGYDNDMSIPDNGEVLDGDVNFDKNFNLYDVIWIAKSLINEFELTEAQVIVADTNGDGVADLHDAINLAKKLME